MDISKKNLKKFDSDKIVERKTEIDIEIGRRREREREIERAWKRNNPEKGRV